MAVNTQLLYIPVGRLVCPLYGKDWTELWPGSWKKLTRWYQHDAPIHMFDLTKVPKSCRHRFRDFEETNVRYKLVTFPAPIWEKKTNLWVIGFLY